MMKEGSISPRLKTVLYPSWHRKRTNFASTVIYFAISIDKSLFVGYYYHSSDKKRQADRKTGGTRKSIRCGGRSHVPVNYARPCEWGRVDRYAARMPGERRGDRGPF